MAQNFKRKQEDFECAKCGVAVEGNGYTNHCPECLYSKHVDVHPGDRACTCNGLMKPAIEEVKTSGITLRHTCARCGHIKLNKASENDKLGNLLKL